jgi:HlyD family secretion protein
VAQSEGEITALGRLEPKGGVIRVAGPSSNASTVISEMHVEEGDVLEKGQVIAELDSYARNQAEVLARRAMLQNAEQELSRSSKLQAGRAASVAARQTAEMEVKVAKARLSAAQAELSLSEVRAPIAGQVLAVHAREGERVEGAGIIELGQTDHMYAVAEVYETDIGRIEEGQKARITSAALDKPLTGTVERVGLLVAKMDVLGTDPVAKTDARVVEVDVRIDDGQDVAKLTYLQVTVEIRP